MYQRMIIEYLNNKSKGNLFNYETVYLKLLLPVLLWKPEQRCPSFKG